MSIRLALIGDVMLGDHPVCFGHGIRSSTQETGLLPKLEPCQPVFKTCDVVIGNLECVLTDESSSSSDLKRNEMRGRASDANSLAAVGIGVLSVANNHMMQHGSAAFRDTVATLRDAGIQPVGVASPSGESNVVVIKKEGKNVAIIAYSFRPEHFVSRVECEYALGKRELVVGQVRDLATEFETIVLCLHWGEEYFTRPSPAQMHLARNFADAGVSVIAGHHPHVLQGMERIGSTVVFYSLGNFLFDSWRKPEKESLIALVDLPSTGGIDIHVEPIAVDENFIVSPCNEADRKNRLSQWQSLCQELEVAKSADEEAYARQAEKLYFRYRVSSYLYFIRNFYRYQPSVLMQSLMRAIRRRFGLA